VFIEKLVSKTCAFINKSCVHQKALSLSFATGLEFKAYGKGLGLKIKALSLIKLLHFW